MILKFLHLNKSSASFSLMKIARTRFESTLCAWCSIGSINFTARSVNRKICRRRDYGRTAVGDGRNSKETNHGKKHKRL